MNPIKKLVAAISAAFSIFSAYASVVYYVTPDGTGGGTSWSDATTLAGANGKVATGDTIRMKAGTYTMTARVQVEKAITIEGGYKGEVGDDLTLADNPETVLDGAYNSSVNEPIYVTTNSSGTNYFYRLAFTRFYRRGFLKESKSSLEMYDCRFLNNSPTYDLGHQQAAIYTETGGGRGGCFAGNTSDSASTATLVLSNCVFQGNVLTKVFRSSKYSGGFGFGANFSNWKEVSLIECSFVDNGFVNTVTNVSAKSTESLYAPVRYGKGAAFYAYKAPIKAVNCKFIGNNYLIASDTSPLQGVVDLHTGCGGSTFDNCAWVGNRVSRGSNSLSYQRYGSSVAVDVGAGNTVDFNNCTIAYNIAGSRVSAAGLTVNTGKVGIRNSIVYGNLVRSSTADPVYKDILVLSANGSVEASTSLFSKEYANSYITETDCKYGNPNFVTIEDDFKSCVNKGNNSYSSGNYIYNYFFDPDKISEVLNFDVHLRSVDGYFDNSGKYYPKGSTDVTSIAIDAGSVESDYSKEPQPNGGVVNLGCYGNTPEASNSPSGGQPTLAKNDVTVTFTEYGQPTVTVTPRAAEESEQYKAIVTISVTGKVKESGIIAEETKSYELIQAGIEAGNTVELVIPEIFEPSSQLSIVIKVSADGAEDVVLEKKVSVSGVLPECYGHGNNNVVHYWADAPGRNDGSSWVNAYRNLADAINDLNEGATELWIAGTNVLSQSVPSYSATIAEGRILGGFTGMEDDAASRKPEAMSVIDGNDLYIPLSLANVNRIYIERIKFVRGSPHNIYKISSAGDLKFRDCQFLDCAKPKSNFVGDPEVDIGLGGYFAGNGTSQLILSNCVFRGNRAYSTDEKRLRGAGAYFKNYAQVVMNDCIFARNGVSFTSQGKGLTFQYNKDGGAFSADNSKIVANRCQFLANNLLSNNNGNYLPSSIVMLNGSLCGGSVFTNCLWAGNQVSKCNTDSYGIPNNAGMLSITTSAAADPVDVVNCTYYCNLVDAQNSPVSINVFAGKLNAVNSIFYGAVTGIYQNVAKQIYVHSGASADISNCLIEADEDVGCEDGGTIVMNDCLFNQDPNFVGIELWNCLNRRISVSNYSNTDTRKKTYINHDNFAIYDMTNLNVHVKSSAGYYDENTGELVTFRRESSPAVDAGKKLGEIKEREPHGNKVNLGFYGNTPWATLSARHGLSVIVR